MFKWIHENLWLPTIYLALTLFLVLGGLDLTLLGTSALVPSAIFAGAVLVARRLPWLSISLIVIGETSEIILGITPSFSSINVAVSLLVIAAFANKRARITALVTTVLGATIVIWFLAFGSFATFADIGLVIREDQKTISFLAALVLISGWLALSWLLGRLVFVRMEYVGSPLDRALTLLTQARLNFELARQNERLDIVRDLSELLIQRVGAVLSLTEGGAYAVRQNPEVAGRVLERASEAAKSAQLELRRLFDLLHADSIIGGVTPRLADLDALVVAYRELGFNAEMRVEGEAFALDEGAEMCLYRIVFESLENVRKHTPHGTNVTIEFTWVAPGLQLLVKDNGIETKNRAQNQLSEIIEGYGVEEDLSALLQQVDGTTLGAMRERAALYEGSVEASAEPGVGFTISAIFPHLQTVIEGK
jgi:signal transduction histidine kinase